MAAGDVMRDWSEAVGRCAGLAAPVVKLGQLADRVDLSAQGPPGLDPSARDVLAIRPHRQLWTELESLKV